MAIKMIDKIQLHEFHYLVERNLKAACDTESTEDKKKYIIRAMQLMDFDDKRRRKETEDTK